MRGTVRIGRISGIDVRLDWSWVLFLLLVIWQLASSFLPALDPEWGPALIWAALLAASLLFLSQQVAESLAAKAKGVPVGAITLFLFSGISNPRLDRARGGAGLIEGSQSNEELPPRIPIEDLVRSVPVADLMTTGAPMVPPNIPVTCLVRDYILGTGAHAFPVIDNGRLVGLVCLQDVRELPQEKWDLTEVGEIMTCAGQLATAKPAESAADALEDLAQRDVDQLPVVDDGGLVGMLRRRDVVNWLQANLGFPLSERSRT